MKRVLIILMSALVVTLATVSAASNASVEKTTPTFTKDVAPIVFKNCVVCHRPGEIGPMALRSYKEVRPWAKSIREVVLARTMPPWGADPQHDEFVNDRRLSQKDMDTLVAWIDSGAKEGNAKDLPPLPEFVEGWQIGKPDIIFSMPEDFNVPADGVVPYKDYAVPTNFTEDMYVQAAEMRVGNRSVVHHAVVNVKEPGSRNRTDEDLFRWQENRLAGYSPGQTPMMLRSGRAKVVKKGSVLMFSMHYTPNGAPAKDRTSIGLIFAKAPVEKRQITAIVGTHHFEIPPQADNHEIRESYTLNYDVHIESLGPHMHSRGKDFLYRVVFPDGRSKVLLWVPRYEFNWQMKYILKEPLALPKGSRIEVIAHYDNSTKNKYNPDPKATVRYGPQTWDEMMSGYLEYTIDSENLLRETVRPQEANLRK